ncbi:MAG TPA: hypothetical protein VMN38_09915 [Sphingomicrobium sp.]|nr:hypothetical protein [Sphingomicrobium sp.]
MSAQLPVVDAAVEVAPHRKLATVALLICIAVLAVNMVLFVDTGVKAIRYPFEIDYGEGIVWQQALRIASGDAYGGIAQFPAIVFHYPPAFHLISTTTAAMLAMDTLAAGRLVALISTLLTSGFAGLVVFRSMREEAGAVAAAICAVIGGLVILTYWPVLVWAPLMRVDMTATALSLAGVYLGIAALRRPALIHAAALCFVAAVYTKQTSIVAPAATFLTLLLICPKVARAGIVTAVLSGLIVLGALIWWTDGGFVRHIFLYNINRFDAWRLRWIREALETHSLYFGVAAIGVGSQIRSRLPKYRGLSRAAARARLAASPADAAMLLVLVYFLLATAMLITIAKSGSNVNYLIEWLCVLAILVGMAMRDAAIAVTQSAPAAFRRRSANFVLAVILPAAVAVQVVMLPSIPDQRRGPIPELRQLVTLIREAQRPVISDDMVLLLRAGKPVVWEPAIFTELASGGLWDERPFVRLVRARHFAFFVTAGGRGTRLFDARYTPAVADAMDAAYPQKRRLAGYTLHFPAEAN